MVGERRVLTPEEQDEVRGLALNEPSAIALIEWLNAERAAGVRVVPSATDYDQWPDHDHDWPWFLCSCGARLSTAMAAAPSPETPGPDPITDFWEGKLAFRRATGRTTDFAPSPETHDLREALDETTRMLAYLWDAEGLVDGVAVRHSFADGDPLHDDVPRVIASARAALAANVRVAPSPQSKYGGGEAWESDPDIGIDSFAPSPETPGPSEYQRGYIAGNLAARQRSVDREMLMNHELIRARAEADDLRRDLAALSSPETPGLDVERLARAMRRLLSKHDWRWSDDGGYTVTSGTTNEFVAAIAREYAATPEEPKPERDTLAALLFDAVVASKEDEDHPDFAYFLADRLIAAGVRVASSPETPGLREAARDAANALALTYTNVPGGDERPHWCRHGFATDHDATCRGMLEAQDRLRAALAATPKEPSG